MHTPSPPPPPLLSHTTLHGCSDAELEAFLNSLSDDAVLYLQHCWPFWARQSQMPPQDNDWYAWVIMAGRGWGKTRTGAEFIHAYAAAHPGSRLALVGETSADARGVMIEGESGLMATAKPWMKPIFQPSLRRLVWPNNTIAEYFSAEEPDQLRGPQFHAAWCDEVAKWYYPASLDNLLLSVRLGQRPCILATTTPRKSRTLRNLLAMPRVFVQQGKSRDNAANLPDAFLEQLEQTYAGTRIGKQELEGILLSDNLHCLWQLDSIAAHRVSAAPDDLRVVIGVDPAVGPGTTGIIAVGLCISNGHAYVLEDASTAASPDTWARRVLQLYRKYKAFRIVAEVNNGGKLVEEMLRTVAAGEPIALRAVHASAGKIPRAEPVAALYEQGRVHHVGILEKLEEEMTDYSAAPGQASPDRMDALVWAMTDLLIQPRNKGEPKVRGV
ncbi:MAG: phage terminase large subunit [Holosporales bacterium]